MGNSKTNGSTGSNPFEPATRTGGPLGSNKDAGDPSTPDWFLGNTQGPLGHGDHADPTSRMCRARRDSDPYGLARALADYQKGKALLCQKVRDELAETYRIHAAFSDGKLLSEARAQKWDTEQYQKAVNVKLFGNPGQGGQGAMVPMYTNPMTCRIVENWNRDRYHLKGLPDIVYDADRAHEMVHHMSCRPDPMKYNADMSFPDRLAENERKAYAAKIEVLERWLQEECL